jgi:hypothetical protein
VPVPVSQGSSSPSGSIWAAAGAASGVSLAPEGAGAAEAEAGGEGEGTAEGWGVLEVVGAAGPVQLPMAPSKAMANTSCVALEYRNALSSSLRNAGV